MPKQLRPRYPALHHLWHLILLSIYVSKAGFPIGYSNFEIELFYQTQRALWNSLAMFQLISQLQTWNDCQDRKKTPKNILRSYLSCSRSPFNTTDIQPARCEIYVSIHLPLVERIYRHSDQLSPPSIWSYLGPYKVFALRAERNINHCGTVAPGSMQQK